MVEDRDYSGRNTTKAQFVDGVRSPLRICRGLCFAIEKIKRMKMASFCENSFYYRKGHDLQSMIDQN